MEAWQEKRSIQTMNLRSVFTPEQQRILERYYDNGMTNQSKSCFQLILQCAQETKLDFSVVRTWVGNKRRKLASKADQNGQPHSLSNHPLAGGAGGAGPLGVLSAELAAARGIQRGPSVAHLLPPTSCPSSSSSPSSCSPHSSGGGSGGVGGSSSSSNNNNNNDVIVTGIYSIGRGSGMASSRLDGTASHARSAASSSKSSLASSSSHRLDADSHPSHARALPVRTDPSALHSRVSIALPHGKSPQVQQPSPSNSLLYGQARKSFLSRDPTTAAAAVAASIPRSWAKQYGTTQPQPWALGTSQPQVLSLPSAPSAPSLQTPPRSSADPSVRIQQVFTLAGLAEAQQRLAMGLVPPRPPDPLETFSIAMETGNADDEYSREEELASMGAQMQIRRVRGNSSSSSSSSSAGEGGSGGGVVAVAAAVAGTSSWMDGQGGGRGSPSVGGRTQVSVALNTPNSDLFGEKGCQTQSSYLAGSGGWGGFPLRLLSHGSPLGMANLKQIPGNVAAPWLISNSRKRTLQDRTQFSDKDLYALKRYWDNGMTSLGSVCREKISAASTELSVDSEIIKTWIGNRRRKYRLMGIEIPPPKGGPPTFPKQSITDPPSPLTPEGPEPKTPEVGEGSEHNDEVSVCLSEDGTSDPYQRESDTGQDLITGGQAENVKIEIIDDDEDDDDGDIMTSDMEQMHSLLEFKHEEVQFLENELENQKQRYFELKSFTRSLLSAVKNNDKERQQELIASLPQLTDDDWEKSPEREEEPSAEEDMTTTTTTSAAPPESSVSEEDGATEGHTYT
ncbi:highly divergent homeobox [Alosa pseudoharengus]|uniref:highly divergent homeobox n=1 Tax=Alosa pseudoharengus TaxID=34774 RepID=UPI003F8A59A8